MAASSLRFSLVPVAAALFFALVVGVLAWKNYSLEGPYDRELQAAEAARGSGDIPSAIALFVPVASGTSTAPAYVHEQALFGLSESLFATGDPGSENEAIQMLKSFIAATDTPEAARSYAVDTLFDLYYIDRSPATFAAIFNGAPFGELERPGTSDKDVLYSAFEQQWETYPTAVGVFHLADWYAGELLDDQSLTVPQRAAYTRYLEEYMEEGESLHQVESPFEESDAVAFTPYEATYQNLDAFLVATLEVQDVSHGQSFDDRYASLENSILREKNNVGLQVFLPYALFYHAAFLELAYGDARQSEAIALASELADVLENKPGADLYFKRFVAVEAATPPAQRDHDYRFLVTLASLSPELKQVLVQYGFTS